MSSDKEAGDEIDGPKRSEESDLSRESRSEALSVVTVEAQNIGWGRWYSLRELEMATNGFVEENVIGEGGYGVVYRGVLPDGSVWPKLYCFSSESMIVFCTLSGGQAQREFKVEVEALEKMLVYEYVDNGNLEQWLHGDVGPVSPLTWDIRMKIAVGTAKGCACLFLLFASRLPYCPILLNKLAYEVEPKVSDFGLAKLLGSEASYVTTRVMGTFGYVSPEYASTTSWRGENKFFSMVVCINFIHCYSVITLFSLPGFQMNLVDWFKGMVAGRRGEELVDPLIEVQPSPRALKRALLVCLRCIDLDANKRPKMGQIVHMLEADEFPFRAEHRLARETDPLPSRVAVTDKISPPIKHAGSHDVEKSKWR
ncbi:putative receptor-like serine/threonine-protein kinase [Vitis vinifera]|uniref:non-specific serine/threonine protein kinase n=1 Tax=Vitis vinifera TaxID=29760 RepID=A0A438C0Y2_VITVI|nr:putative receptor-like serine/threonine-protein kinase [Vitis vinifera]